MAICEEVSQNRSIGTALLPASELRSDRAVATLVTLLKPSMETACWTEPTLLRRP
jgi:hypothetical protein